MRDLDSVTNQNLEKNFSAKKIVDVGCQVVYTKVSFWT